MVRYPDLSSARQSDARNAEDDLPFPSLQRSDPSISSTHNRLSSSTGGVGGPATPRRAKAPPVPMLGRDAMGDGPFEAFLAKLSSLPSNEDRLLEAEEESCRSLFTCAQIAAACGLTPSVKTRQRLVELMGPRCVDPKNNAAIVALFRFAADKDRASQVLRGREQVLDRGSYRAGGTFRKASMLSSSRRGRRKGHHGSVAAPSPSHESARYRQHRRVSTAPVKMALADDASVQSDTLSEPVSPRLGERDYPARILEAAQRRPMLEDAGAAPPEPPAEVSRESMEELSRAWVSRDEDGSVDPRRGDD